VSVNLVPEDQLFLSKSIKNDTANQDILLCLRLVRLELIENIKFLFYPAIEKNIF